METTSYSSTKVTGQRFKVARRSAIWSCLALFFFVFTAFTAAAKPHPLFVPGQILVKPRTGVSESSLAAKLSTRGAVSRRTLHHLNVRVVNVPERNADALIAALKHDPDIEFAERDYIAEAAFVPNDPLTGDEWHLAKIQAFQAWNGTTGNSSVIVAVLDSGVNMNHPDLAGRLLQGYDFVNSTSTVTDDFGHGTAVTGTIAADGNNGVGVAGVAFGCSVLPVKVMDANGFASYSTIATGIKYAVDNGARIINMSLAGAAPSQTLQDAIDDAWSNNVVVVAAAGNSSTNSPEYPAACAHVLGVSATAQDDSLAYFSNYGTYVGISAPGQAIWTTQRDPNNPYSTWQGTSFASPIVSAAAALVISVNPTLSNDQVVSLLEQSADDLGAPGYDTSYGYGRVNVFRAVTMASATPGAVVVAPQGTAAVALSSPVSGSQYITGTNITLQAIASASTPGGSITNLQFVVNGVSVATGSGSSFSANWSPSLPGGYAIVAIATDDHGQTATSAESDIQVINLEKTSPTITVLSAPPNGASVTSPSIFIAGTASDSTAVVGVYVSLNNGLPEPATGTTNWSAQISFIPGLNNVRVYCVDTFGNVSPSVELSYTYVASSTLATLTVQTSGVGSVSPNLNGAQLEIGRTYKLKARPGPGQVFAGWNGDPSQPAALTFVMQSNLVLAADFVPSPFPAVQGNYAGLADNTNAVTPANSGYFDLKVTAAGAFTGKLLIGGGRYGFNGQFSVTGDSTVSVSRGLNVSPLSLSLHLDLSNNTDRVDGSLTDGAWVSDVSGDRNVFNSKANPAAQAGLRNFILRKADNTAVQAGVGQGAISASGAASVSGSLDNGTKFKTASMLAKNGDCPFFLSLNKGTQIVIGWLNFPTVPNPTASGTVLWVSTGTNTFSAQLQAASAP